MRAIKIVGLIVAGLAVLVGAALAALAIGGGPLVAELIEARASAALARRVTIGHLDIHWGRPLIVVGDGIRIANAAWGSTPDMLQVKHVELELDPSALLSLSLRLRHVVIDEPALFLETSAQGKRNWTRTGDPETSSSLSRVSEIGRAVLRHGRFHFRNGETSAETDIALDELAAQTPDADSPINIAARGIFQRQSFALTAVLAPLGHLRAGSPPYPVKLEGHLGSNNFLVDGTVGGPLVQPPLALRVDLKGQDIQELLATLGVPVPKMPIYRLAGELQRDGERWRFTGVTGHIGESQVHGDILVDEGQSIPYIKADLSADYLDLADLRGFYGADPGRHPEPPRDQGERGRVIPDMHPPIAKLLGLNADVSLDAPRVKPVAGLPFEHVAFTVSLKDGTLRIDPVRVAIAQGEMQGDLEYRSTESPPRFRTDIEIRRLDLHRLLAGTALGADLKETAGVLGGFAKLESSGATQRQILAGSHGDIGLFLAGGRLSSSLARMFEHDIAEALGLAPTSHRPHPINCLIARFAARSGVATATTLLLDTDQTIVTGEGNINLADETFFIDLKPFPKHAGSSRFGVPLEIRGTFAEPDIAAEKVGLVTRLGAAIGLVKPPAVLLPLVDTGLGDKNKCRQAFAVAPPVGEGSSAPPRRR